MNGIKQNLTYLIEGKKTRFVIPVYQRNYDWKPEQCARLFDDLVEVVKTGREEHFFGSIVSQTPHDERIIIDGQQRITTVFLLLAAIRKQLRDGVISAEDPELADDIEDDYLLDRKHKKDQKLRLKLIKSDSDAFAAVLEDGNGSDDVVATPLVQGSNVTQNYLYFLDRLATMEIPVDDLIRAIESLCVIDITLDSTDDAQLIFESLNSTGLDLSEADKIRNFVLMNLDQERQEAYYEDYWNVIEKNTDYEVSDFIRYYLAALEGRAPAMKKVYPAFRLFALKNFHKEGADELEVDTKALLSEMLTYSRHYRCCIHPDTGVDVLDLALKNLSLLDARVVYPYLLNLLEYRRGGFVGDDAASDILCAIDSYLFRRWVCQVPSSALNKIFETLHSEAVKGVDDGADYPEIVKYLLTHKAGTGRFPSDDEFVAAVVSRDFYRIGNRKYYLYDRLENGGSKERLDVVGCLESGAFSVEHVMPQTLSDSWKEALGDDWERIHEQWTHRMANLTLTAYNSDYSNRPFDQKRDMKDGFKDSGFRMNQWIAKQEAWGETQLLEREELLEKQFLETWPMATSAYVPRRVMPEEATLDSDAEFTGRRITAFSFMGARYTVSQWNDMETLALKLLLELEPAKIHALVGGQGFPASAFRSSDAPGFSKIANGVYAKTASSTAFKIDLLKKVFAVCGVDANDLSFEMPLDKS